MELIPLTRDAARAFIAEHHRHSRAPQGDIIRVGLAQDGELVAVGTAGRPISRILDDGRTLEITRVCTLGTVNAASMIYGALCRAGRALGYQRAITYTLQSEPGSSVRAAGFTIDAEDPRVRKTWSTPARARTQTNLFGEEERPIEPKRRWLRVL